MSKYLEVPPDLQLLLEKRNSEDRRKRRQADKLLLLGIRAERRSGKDRRNKRPSKKA